MATKGQNSPAAGFLKNLKAFLKKDFLNTLIIPSKILISYTAKKKWLKVYKTIQISNTFLVLRKSTRPPAENVVPKFLIDATFFITSLTLNFVSRVR